jgi:RNA polymerase sigma factor (sigma-70 family)
MLCDTNAATIEDALARHQRGDEQAFHELIALAYDWLGRRVVTCLRDYPSVQLPAEEILHENVLARLRRVVASKKPSTCAELARLAAGSIRWSLRDLVRQRRRTPEPADSTLVDDDAADPVADLIDDGDRARFHEAAAALPEPLRRVFCLRYYAGYSEQDVAADLGVSERSVRTYWRQAIDGISVAVTGRPFAGELPRLRRQGDGEGSPLCGCPPSS